MLSRNSHTKYSFSFFTAAAVVLTGLLIVFGTITSFAHSGKKLFGSLDFNASFEQTLVQSQNFAVDEYLLNSPASVYAVINTNDSGAGSLRQAIADANNNAGDDTIVFQNGLGNITLTSGELSITSNIAINGNESSPVTIARSAAADTPNFRIFNVAAGAVVSFGNLTISNGNLAGANVSGGGINNQGTLTLTNSTITGNRAVAASKSQSSGGGIYNTGSLSATGGSITGNSAGCAGSLSDCPPDNISGYGGGIYNTGAMTLIGTSVTGNRTVGSVGFSTAGEVFGGGIYNTGTADLMNSPVSGNAAEATRGYGGGIYNTNKLNLTNSSISGNSVNAGIASTSSTIGGGVYNSDSGSLTILSTTIENNAVSGANIYSFGAGIFNQGSLTANDSTISANRNTARNDSVNRGGGIYNQGTLSLTNSTITGNRVVAASRSQSDGGGIYNTGLLTVTNGVVTGNSAGCVSSSSCPPDNIGGYGGGIYNTGAMTLIGTSVTDNQTVGSFGLTSAGVAGGGGIVNGETGTANLTNCTVKNNIAVAARSYGGGIYNYNILNVTGSSIINNSANGGQNSTSESGGGGIYSVKELVVVNSTVSGNTGSAPNNGSQNVGGGGIYLKGTASLKNVTVSGNSHSEGRGSIRDIGGGIRIEGTLRISNTIVATNFIKNSPGTPSDVSGTAASEGYNLIGAVGNSSGWINSDILNRNPLLAKLDNYGGTTLTQALLPDSPAINAGNNANAPATDQRGSARIVGGIIDIGAFEANIDVSPAALPNAVSGTPYNQQLTASSQSGSGAFTFSISDGALPDGLTLSANGVLSGTPTGSGTFTFTVKATDADGMAGVRQYTLTFECFYSVSPQSFSISSTGGQNTFNVTATTGCSYNAVSNASWLTVNTAGSQTGSGTIAFTAAPNTGPERTGTITVAGLTVTVTQASGCTFTLSPTGASLSGNAGNGSFSITASADGCVYSAASNNSFITVTSGASGTGTGTISYSISANPGGARTGTITAGGQTFTITQAELPNLTINNVTLNEGESGTTAFNFTVSLSAASSQPVTVNYSTTNGTATAGEDYAAINGTLTFAAGEVNKVLTVSVSGDNLIEGNETFTINLGNATNAVITVAQGTGTILNDDACSYSISPTSLSIDGTGGAGNTITVTTQAGCAYTAVSNDSFITINSGANNSGGGTVRFTVAANTGAARAGTITIGGQTFTVNQAAAAAAVPQKPLFDFDGDKKADIALFRPSNTVWYVSKSSGGASYTQFGLATDKITPADFDGDGKTDIAVYRPETGVWFILNSASATGGYSAVQFGSSEDIPVPADYNGDGKAEIAVFRPSIGVWFFYQGANIPYTAVQFGSSEDRPVAADYNGDGKTEIAVFRPSTGVWFFYDDTSKGYTAARFGLGTDKAVPADYTGDGRTDLAVYRPSEGNWYIQPSDAAGSKAGGYTVTRFGLATDLPTPADYDGDGRADIALYRPAEGNWYLLNTQTGFNIIRFGISEDKPVPNAFVR